MNLKNRVQLIGNLGKDPIVKVLETGMKVAKFSIATTDYYLEKGEKKEKASWHNIVAWGKTADIVEEKCSKGIEVVVMGKLTNHNYEDKSGVKKYVTEVVISEIICRPQKVAS
jgi:single-strand DNA-binding protein